MLPRCSRGFLTGGDCRWARDLGLFGERIVGRYLDLYGGEAFDIGSAGDFVGILRRLAQMAVYVSTGGR